jgi:hypothetical protein
LAVIALPLVGLALVGIFRARLKVNLEEVA